MPSKDYYKIMGLKRTASSKEIKQAYRKLAHKYHPDVSKLVDAEEKFKELRAAYSVLKDSKKRAIYDQQEDELDAGWHAYQKTENQPPPPPPPQKTERSLGVWIAAIIIIFLCSRIKWPFGFLIAIIILQWLFMLY